MEELRFAHIDMLYALLAVPVLVVAGWWIRRARRRALQRWGDATTLSAMMPAYSGSRTLLKWAFVVSAWALLIVTAANPLIGQQQQEVTREGIDIIVALDVSNSMLAEDLAPNRLERARQFISRFIDRLRNDRIGLIIFAGNAYLQMPLTTDHGAAKVFLRTISTDQVPTQGTALASSIQLAEEAFTRSESTGKALIILSDGEDHEEGLEEAAETAAANGLTIYTIGIGTPKGTPIPDFVNGIRRGFKKDNSGNTVLTRLNETVLNKLAISGGGIYFNLTGSTDQLNTLMNHLDGLEKSAMGTIDTDNYVSYYQLPLALALLLLLLDSLLGRHKNRFWQRLMNRQTT